MHFHDTPLAGACVIEIERLADERGFFGRSFCPREFAQHGIEMRVVQCNVSFNARRGTLRGMHFQAAPKGEPKLVRCTRGAIFDVVVDLRPESPTHRRWFGVELSAANLRQLFIPIGLAHGFVTLADDSEVFYQMGEFFSPEHARGVRWNDPAFGIEWPIEPAVISSKDQNYADYRPTEPPRSA
jgi:dTDP-4-dehydrorhamnose 3,5-epimerase